jgi:membrane associated rhomboid family serine protease
MQSSGIISLFIIVANFFASYQGFKNHLFYDKYSFKVDNILLYKDYKRIVTAGFLHVNWMHLIFNMLAFYFFSSGLESAIGGINFLIIYFAGLVGGNLLTLLLHKDDGGYSSVGASGAIAGVIFTTIALTPGMKIGLLFLPISIPAWLFGLLYILYSIYGIRSKKDNIGHDAHLGGALVGMAVGLIMYPAAIASNYVTILIISLPAMAFIILIINQPSLLLIDNLFYKRNRQLNVEDKYNLKRKTREHEIDDILEKIHKKGMDSLTKKEKTMLKEFSKQSQ